jgi:RNA polymerase sigma-70 factor, ECF subfamily
MQETDEDIVSKVQSGDTEAFGVLIDRYDAKLNRYAQKFLIYDEVRTDLVQDVFSNAYININGFDTHRRFSPWIYRIAHNTFINELKRRDQAPSTFFDTDIIMPYLRAKETADGDATHEEMKHLLEHSLSEVSPKYREPLVLYFYDNMSYKDIGEILQIPLSTVGMRISRGKEQLRKEYEAKHGTL